MKKNVIYQKGQSLVEILVVIGIVVLLTTGIVAGTTVSLSRSETAQSRTEALAFAQAGIELARGWRDQGWDPPAVEGTYCVGSDGVFGQKQAACTAANINGIYTRSMNITQQSVNGVNSVKAVSSVSWGDPSSSKQVQLTTYLTQWR